MANPAVFADIFDRHHGELYRYLRRQVGADLAADLAGEFPAEPGTARATGTAPE